MTAPHQTDFSDEFFAKILSRIDKSVAARPKPWIAAFDADGTLWDTDVGERFFDFQIHECGLSGLPADPWKHYRDLKAVSRPKAYLWLAQINAGHSLSQVRTWAQESFQSPPQIPFFFSIERLISELKKRTFEIYVVTASIEWAIEPAAKHFGIPEDNILGVKSKVDSSGKITLEQDGHITWKEGKAAALLEKTKGVHPLVCLGNTDGDVPLLEASSDLAIALRSKSNSGNLKSAEEELYKVALSKQWLTHCF